jgi:hypothetical protein
VNSNYKAFTLQTPNRSWLPQRLIVCCLLWRLFAVNTKLNISLVNLRRSKEKNSPCLIAVMMSSQKMMKVTANAKKWFLLMIPVLVLV